MNRRYAIAVVLAVAAAPGRLLAQRQGKVWRIGVLAVDSRESLLESGRYGAFLKGMLELGYVEGKSFAIEGRFADGRPDRLSDLAVDLVRANVDAMLVVGSEAAQAAKRATGTIPIVVGAASDPVGSGFAATLQRPGGNMTGLSLNVTDVSPKRLELLKLIVPKLARVAVLVNQGNSAHPAMLKSVQDIERGLAAATRERPEAVIVPADAYFFSQRGKLAALTVKQRLPAVFAYREPVEAGGLMSYGTNIVDNYRRAASYVDKILKGARPGDLPFEQPTTFDLVINRKTAKILGLTIPKELLLRADEVIE